MTLQQLRYLIAVADHGSITAAAAAVFVAQPALSRAIRALERELNVELLARDGRGVAFTSEGARVVRLARTIITTVGAIEDIGRPGDPRHCAELRVVTTPTLAIDLEAVLVPSFTEAHPNVSVEVLRCDGRELLVRKLYKGHADLGLVDLPVDEHLKAHRVQEREVVLVSPPGTGLPATVPMPRLDGLPMILATRGTGRRTEQEAMFALLGIRPVAALESDQRIAWVSAVLEGVGSLIWYRDMAERTFAHRAEIRSFDPPVHRSVGLVHLRGNLSRAARSFVLFARPGAAPRMPPPSSPHAGWASGAR
ncbi:LysR family transcriptional regulator [Actinomadura fulvescens]|uniref:LysR family transcriptional regulator n=1 Tax=Actinomadura fulvescens TaxID=46160 RepID=A0ABP6BUT3_9ACTN